MVALGAFNRKALSTIVGMVGAAALCLNVHLFDGDKQVSHLLIDQRSLAMADENAVEVSQVDDRLLVDENAVEVSQVDGRLLGVAVNGLTEGYYSEVGVGMCIDPTGKDYDYASFNTPSAAKCAKKCSENLLLSEHRGFNYDEVTKECCCLFDDHQIPRPVKMKANYFNIAPNGKDSVAGTATVGDSASLKCYKKVEAVVGNSIESYVKKDCTVDDGEILDVVEFKTVFTKEKCADKCIRFKLMQAHVGFTQDGEGGTCSCLFEEGEMPTRRKLANSGAFMEKKRTFQERFDEFIDEPNAHCYDLLDTLESAPATDQVTPDANNRVWINEFHFRNYGQSKPFVEVIGPIGTSAADYEVYTYQGRNGGMFKDPIPLNGTFTNPSGGDWGFVTFDLDKGGLRKGKQGCDGIALVKDGTDCLQFLSYSHIERKTRSYMATEGPCSGKASMPIGVTEDRETPVTHSLQLLGSGNKYDDFDWTGPIANTRGAVNTDQILLAP